MIELTLIERVLTSLSCRYRKRSGSVLILSLVFIAFFAVIVYSYTATAGLELAQTSAREKLIQQRFVAESVLELVRASRIQNDGLQSFNTPIFIESSQGTSLRGAVLLQPTTNDGPKFGLLNESAKLNLCYLATNSLSRDKAIEKLMRTPGLSQSTAASIVDHLRNTYSVGGPSSKRPLVLCELLRVPGVNAHLLYGLDQNRDGIVEPHERIDKQGVRVQHPAFSEIGWSKYWTTISGESTIRSNGTPKIRLNQPNLAQLYDELIQHFTPDEARFVVAWRLAPAKYGEDRTQQEIDDLQIEALEQRKQTFEQRVAQQLVNQPSADAGNSSSGQERAGIRLDSAIPIRIPSLVALCQCKIQIAVRGQDQVLDSPFPDTVEALGAWLVRWEELTTLSNEAVDFSRINIHQAPIEALMTIEGMTESLANTIVNSRGAIRDSTEVQSVAWLLSQRLLSWKELRTLSPEMTVGGDVVSGLAVGEVTTSRTASQTYFILDRTSGRLRWLVKRDLDPVPAFLPR